MNVPKAKPITNPIRSAAIPMFLLRLGLEGADGEGGEGSVMKHFYDVLALKNFVVSDILYQCVLASLRLSLVESKNLIEEKSRA
jgi:hypothetical protein